VEKGGHFVNMLIRPLRLDRFWPILYIKFFEVYLSQSNREIFCRNLFQVKCYISPANCAWCSVQFSAHAVTKAYVQYRQTVFGTGRVVDVQMGWSLHRRFMANVTCGSVLDRTGTIPRTFNMTPL